ncbi:hypothetical protein RN001_002554 [Aquatica leii]|uniref:MADF domain-containing protein n=1 Tax=Aquatica leii TaxID=1421715 RepID=A0AAN7PHD5_9COLE|nr:hypothetical protein RN001_002554 [Aquatica leii]
MWSQEQETELINEYQKYPCLYAVKSKDYKNRHARAKALENIQAHLNIYKKDVTASDIKTKFNALKSNFMTEYKKVVASQKSGADDEDVYVPTLWYYTLMYFVLEHNLPRLSIDSISISQSEPIEIDEELHNDDLITVEPVKDATCPTPLSSNDSLKQNQEENSVPCIINDNLYLCDETTGERLLHHSIVSPSPSMSSLNKRRKIERK